MNIFEPEPEQTGTRTRTEPEPEPEMIPTIVFSQNSYSIPTYSNTVARGTTTISAPIISHNVATSNVSISKVQVYTSSSGGSVDTWSNIIQSFTSFFILVQLQ